MLVDVAVFASKDPAKNLFTYVSDTFLPLGTVIVVPFGRKKSLGVVWKYIKETAIKNPLSIISVVSPTPLITTDQQVMINMIGKMHHASVSSMMPLCLPQFPKIAAHPLFQNLKHHEKRVKQTLILAPSLHFLDEIALRLTKRHTPFVTYHGDQTMNERLRTYRSVFEGKVNVILATRIGLFLPFQKLEKIYMYDEHDWGYKEQHQPQFHALDAATLQKRNNNAQCIIIDSSPRIQTYWHYQKSLKLDKTPLFHMQTPKNDHPYPTHIVDMAMERKKGNDSIISEPLSQYIRQAVIKKVPILLYLNKKNDGGLLYCRSCKTATYLPSSPQACPNCKSTDFLFDIYNVKNAARAISQLLHSFGFKEGLWHSDAQGSLITLHLPKDDVQSSKLLTGIPILTIATQKVLYKAKPGTYRALGVLLVDSMLNVPEFRAPERTYATLTQLARLLSPPKNGKATAHIIIQTRQPDSFVFRYFAEHNYAGFYHEELKERKTQNYPPFTDILLCSFMAKTVATMRRHADALFEQFSILQNSLKDSTVEIVGPFMSLRERKEVRILLKGRKDALEAFIGTIPKNWKLDFDPENILT